MVARRSGAVKLWHCQKDSGKTREEKLCLHQSYVTQIPYVFTSLMLQLSQFILFCCIGFLADGRFSREENMVKSDI